MNDLKCFILDEGVAIGEMSDNGRGGSLRK
jgi:hypothetical protein